MSKLRTLLASLMFAVTVFVPVSAYAASGSSGEACGAVAIASPDGKTCDDPAGPSIQKVVVTAIRLISIVAGVIAVIMLIVGGFMFITSEGDGTKAANARKTIIYAVVGIVVVVFAQVLVKFVFKKVS